MDETPVKLEATGGPMDRVRSVNRLRPVARKGWWIGVGLAVQLIAVAIPTAFVVVRAKHEDFAGLTIRSTVLVAARDALHDRTGVAALVGATILFALGSMVLARPYVHSVGMLFVAVPLAAIVGVLVLGAIALVVVVVVAIAANAPTGTGGGGGSGSGSGSGGNSAKKPEPAQAKPASPR